MCLLHSYLVKKYIKDEQETVTLSLTISWGTWDSQNKFYCFFSAEITEMLFLLSGLCLRRNKEKLLFYKSHLFNGWERLSSSEDAIRACQTQLSYWYQSRLKYWSGQTLEENDRCWLMEKEIFGLTWQVLGFGHTRADNPLFFYLWKQTHTFDLRPYLYTEPPGNKQRKSKDFFELRGWGGWGVMWKIHWVVCFSH